MTEDLKNKLDAIVGKEFNYQGENIKIERYKYVNNTNVVVFTPRPNNFLVDEVPGFLEQLYVPTEKPITAKQFSIPENKMKTFEPTAENATVKATLLETLEKVKKDASYIPQATAVCSVVSQIVNVQKTEIQMLALLSK